MSYRKNITLQDTTDILHSPFVLGPCDEHLGVCNFGQTQPSLTTGCKLHIDGPRRATFPNKSEFPNGPIISGRSNFYRVINLISYVIKGCLSHRTFEPLSSPRLPCVLSASCSKTRSQRALPHWRCKILCDSQLQTKEHPLPSENLAERRPLDYGENVWIEPYQPH